MQPWWRSANLHFGPQAKERSWTCWSSWDEVYQGKVLIIEYRTGADTCPYIYIARRMDLNICPSVPLSKTPSLPEKPSSWQMWAKSTWYHYKSKERCNFFLHFCNFRRNSPLRAKASKMVADLTLSCPQTNWTIINMTCTIKNRFWNTLNKI